MTTRGRPRLYTPEVAYARMIARTTQYLQENQAYRMYHNSKQRAKRADIEFDLALEDIDIPIYCPLLGIELTNTFGEGRVPSNASLDRIDSSKGYVRGNIQVISDLANRMKQDASKEQLIAFARNILKIYEEPIDKS